VIHEIGPEDSLLLALHAHRELVPKMPGRRVAHPGDAEVLADRRGCFHVEVVERDDAIEAVRARQIRDRSDRFLQIRVVTLREHLGEDVAWPRAIEQALDREQVRFRSERGGFAQEALALVVAREAEDVSRHDAERIPGIRDGRASRPP
jgi:hypothetical protein